MKKPVRIQRKRTKGWRMPPNTVYVGRPSKWGNPWKVGKEGNLQSILGRYKARFFNLVINGVMMSDMAKKELKGKNLCCWCPLDQPCHADILLKIANKKLL